MPNWCECELTVSGEEETLETFCREALYHETVDGRLKVHPFQIRSFLPIPPDLLKAETGSMERVCDLYNDWTEERGLIEYAEDNKVDYQTCVKAAKLYQNNLKTYGCKTWYDWCVEKWGTKWDVDGCSYPEKGTHVSGDVEQLYRFNSAWSPPLAAITSISEMRKSLDFTMNFWEGGAGYQGRLRVLNGHVIINSFTTYRGSRGG